MPPDWPGFHLPVRTYAGSDPCTIRHILKDTGYWHSHPYYDTEPHGPLRQPRNKPGPLFSSGRCSTILQFFQNWHLPGKQPYISPDFQFLSCNRCRASRKRPRTPEDRLLPRNRSDQYRGGRAFPDPDTG